jgi:hypothetical protein
MDQTLENVDETNTIFFFQDKANSNNKSDIGILDRQCLSLSLNFILTFCDKVANT